MVYVDDIVITSDDAQEFKDLKQYLLQYFHAKDLESLRYFLKIKVTRSKKENFLILSEVVLLEYKAVDTLIGLMPQC